MERAMNSLDTQSSLILVAVAIALLIGVGVWLVYQKRQSHRLERRFGPEYGRAVDQLGSRAKAESELKTREQRVEQLHIVPLPPSDAARFHQAWKALQAGFVDNPKGVVAQADQLVRELLLKRGYPMGDFERRAADISVDHPGVSRNSRAALEIAARAERGDADTEDLRKAVVHFRALFDELLEVDTARPESATTRKMETES
jgi:hypothetical protein